MTVETVTIFRTPDNHLHLTQSEAERHQAGLELEAFIEEKSYNGMRPQDIANMVKENAPALAALLSRINPA